MTEKQKTLQAIFRNCGFDNFDLVDYDLTQPDSMDESGSGGAWDLAGEMVDDVLSLVTTQDTDDDCLQGARDKLQSLLYNLICDYKNEPKNE